MSLYIFCILLLTTLAASQNTSLDQWSFSKIPPSVELIWYPCVTNLYCAVLDVPLDYTDDCNTARAYVPLIKLEAQRNSSDGPYKGMILTNPGGPGDSGIDFLISTSTNFSTVIGSNYDFVSFDPRGLWRSLPSANCTPPPSPSVTRRQLPKLYAPSLLDSSFAEALASSKVIGDACQKQIGGKDQAGPHMTTATNARDMISITDAFARSADSRGVENAKLINYWGFSYGTVIGQTLASMFPDRIGRVVLDGVVDLESYINGTHVRPVVKTDEAIATFFVYCQLAGPEKCPFATTTSVKASVERFERIIFQLDPNYAAAHNWTNTTAIELVLKTVKGALFQTAYSPIQQFPSVGEYLPIVESLLNNGSLDAIIQLISQAAVPDSPPETNSYEEAVRCTDLGGNYYNKTIEYFRPLLQSLRKQSAFAGDLILNDLLQCVGWPILSDDRYAGPFGGKTLNPMLFVSNTLDPITPITSGRKWSKQYQGAELLTIEGTGHTSIAAQNTCSDTKISAFFQTGQMLQGNDFCKLEAGPFGIIFPGGLEGNSDFQVGSARIRGLLGGRAID